jgi:hypothetical protein
MNLTLEFGVCFRGNNKQGNLRGNIMRKMILGTASALALASPAVAADPPVTPYSSYQEEYEYRTAPPVVVEEPPAAVIVRRRVMVAPPVVVDEYPVYAAPPVYAYAGPVWRPGWGFRGRFHGGW